MIQIDYEMPLHFQFLAEFLASKSSVVGHRRRLGDRIDVSAILNNTESFGQNATFRDTENDVIGEPYATLINMDHLKDECVQLHHRIRHKLRDNGMDVKRYNKVGRKCYVYANSK